MASSPGFQSGNAGFESRWDHCGCSITGSALDCDSKECGFDSRQSPCNLIYAVCPGGEGAVLKTVGLKGLAGSNPVCGVKKSGIIDNDLRSVLQLSGIIV